MTRTGKIARLPKEIRQKLNERLREGETAKRLVSWLNRLPEVQAIVASAFGGVPIREQNISEWRKGGYMDWKQRRAAIEVAVHLGQVSPAQQPPLVPSAALEAARRKGEEPAKPTLNEALVLWLMREYAVATRELAESGDEEKQARLRQMSANMMRLRRVERQAAKLKLARKAFAWEKERERMRRARRKAQREKRYETPQEPMTPEEFEAYARQQRAILAKPNEKDKWERYLQRKSAGSPAQQPPLVPSGALAAEEPASASLREDAAGRASAKDQADPGSAAGASRTPTDIRPDPTTLEPSRSTSSGPKPAEGSQIIRAK